MIPYYFYYNLKNKLIKGLKNKAGRNFYGRICIQGRGCGNKRNYRFIDFIRRLNYFGKIIKIYRDPIRTAKISLILYSNGLMSFSLIQKDIKINSIIYAGSIYDNSIKNINNGYSLTLKYMPLFSPLSNIELKPYGGSKIVRAAYVNCLMISKNDKSAILKLNSK
jgi:large subunit ribosomal protein L2